MTAICVFCGSSMGYNDVYRKAALETALFFAEKNIELVYGGGDVGLMKILADTLLEKGSRVTGVIPGNLVDRGVVHHNLSRLIVVDSMADRKHKMAELSDGFVALPGGFGTLDELAEILTYNQLRISDKPLGILNVNNYFDGLLTFFDRAVEDGFVRKEHRDNLIVSENIGELLEKMASYEPVSMEKWITDIKTESNHR